jgi:hypothetical protein
LLKYFPTPRKVVVSIPSGVTGIFHWHYPPGRTTFLGSTHPLTILSTRNIGKAKENWRVMLKSLPPLCVDSLEIWEPQPPGILEAYTGLYWDSFTFNFTTFQMHIRKNSTLKSTTFASKGMFYQETFCSQLFPHPSRPRT